MSAIEIHLQAATTPSAIEVAHQSRLKATKKKALNETKKKLFTLETSIKRRTSRERKTT